MAREMGMYWPIISDGLLQGGTEASVYSRADSPPTPSTLSINSHVALLIYVASA